MAYQVKCDGYILHDIRDEELILYNPKVKVETNKVGSCSFKIYKNHPYYDKLKILRSVFEVSDEIGVIFRGRMTEDTRDFNNGKAVDLEGAMALFNDSLISPYSFPEDFKDDDGYITASKSGNVVEFYLNWLIAQHNSQVDEFQRFKLGKVTVSDPNNYISRSSENDVKTWNELKTKLFDSSLGGYLCIRYETDGNYIDYLSDFEYMNTQEIVFGENLLDLLNKTDGSSTCTAIKPLGAELDEQAETSEVAKRLTIESLPDGDITDDIVKKGSILYSKSAREKYGMIFADVDKTTWNDVKVASNLLTKGTEWLSSVGVMLSGTIEINAVDLHFSDEEIRSFRIYRKIRVTSEPHGISKMYNLTKLDIDLFQPQNTKITAGEKRKTLTQDFTPSKGDPGKDGKPGKDAAIISSAEPSDKTYLWCDTSSKPPVLKQWNGEEWIIVNDNAEQITQIYKELASSISQASDSILIQVGEKTYTKEETDRLISDTNTLLEQTKNAFNFEFNSFKTNLDNLANSTDARFESTSKYIRFIDGEIFIGVEGNPIMLRQRNDRISFLENNVEVAYISNRTLYFTHAEILKDLKIGQFGFVVMESGFVPFKLIE